MTPKQQRRDRDARLGAAQHERQAALDRQCVGRTTVAGECAFLQPVASGRDERELGGNEQRGRQTRPTKATAAPTTVIALSTRG